MVDQLVKCLILFLPKQPAPKSSPFPAYTKSKPSKIKNPIATRSKNLASSLDSQIAELEASMEYLLGAKARKEEKPMKDVPRFSSGEWSMDFDVNRKTESNPENAGNTRLLSSVLDQLLTNPYMMSNYKGLSLSIMKTMNYT